MILIKGRWLSNQGSTLFYRAPQVCKDLSDMCRDSCFCKGFRGSLVWFACISRLWTLKTCGWTLYLSDPRRRMLLTVGSKVCAQYTYFVPHTSNRKPRNFPNKCGSRNLPWAIWIPWGGMHAFRSGWGSKF